MTPQPQPKTSTRLGRATLFLATGAVLFFLAMPGTAAPGDNAGDDAAITVVFDEDDMGFNATSSKDISNVWVVLCDGSEHKHDDLDGTSFVHREEQLIAGVYVKSGNNGIEGNDPPGAGEFFANEGVDCDGSSSETPTSTTTTTSSTDTTTEPEVPEEPETPEEPEVPEEPETPEEPEVPEEEIPFFGAPLTIGLGLVGAAGGAMLMLRRRL